MYKRCQALPFGDEAADGLDCQEIEIFSTNTNNFSSLIFIGEEQHLSARCSQVQQQRRGQPSNSLEEEERTKSATGGEMWRSRRPPPKPPFTLSPKRTRFCPSPQPQPTSPPLPPLISPHQPLSLQLRLASVATFCTLPTPPQTH